MKTNYWNPTTREYGHVVETKATGVLNGKKNVYCANYRNKRGAQSNQICESFKYADEVMKKNGYERVGLIDETGCRRYTMALPELQALYKQMEEFVADCTQEEYNENKAAITAVYSLIHKHINAETFK